MNDADMYDVMHAQTADELAPAGSRRPVADRAWQELLREAMTLIYRTVLEVDAEHHRRDKPHDELGQFRKKKVA